MNPSDPLQALFSRVLSPFERFHQSATAGGIVLVAATAIALTLATVLGDETMHRFWEQKLAIEVGPTFRFELSLHHWINDALMALFFLLVGLELKREILVGELASLKDAALPVAAAIGGMIVPALIYAAFNLNTDTARGWGIPTATDIAFAVGILVLLSWRVPKNLILFLTALAIADDLGAVLIIALFYTAELNGTALAWTGALFAILLLINRGGVRHPLPYGLIGIALWYAVLFSGIHATIAGILLAMAIPARAAYTSTQFDRRIAELHAAFRNEDAGLGVNTKMAAIAESVERTANAVQSPLQRIEHGLSPWVTFLIVPLFALSNAGIDLFAIQWYTAFSERVTLGICIGLLFGKFAGIGLFSWLALRMGLARLPTGVGWRHLLGAAWLGGIGFTMSLFIAQLAFIDPGHIEQAKLGILSGSALSAAIGLTWLYCVADKRSQ